MEEPRKLTKNEIINIVAFIKPTKGIPRETALSLVRKVKKQLVDQLNGIEIVPLMIPALADEIETQYYRTLIQAGESVGVIAGQSIGEKQTQTNLNSVDWTDKIIYTSDGVTRVEPIGALIDRMLESATDVTVLENGTEYLKIDYPMSIPSSDENGMLQWLTIEAVTRHPPGGKLVKVTTQSGRVVSASQAKSFLTWNGEVFVDTLGSVLNVGDILPTTSTLAQPKKIVDSFDMRTIFPPTKYLYTTEVVKAREYKLSGEVDWWRIHNGKDFVLPYKRGDTLFGKRKNFYMSVKPGYVYIQKSSNVSHFPESMPLDEDFGFLIGIYLANGLVNKTYTCISNNDQVIRRRIADWCDKFVVTYHLVTKEVNGVISTGLKIHSCLIARMLKIMCYNGSSNKTVPEFAYNAPLTFVKGLIDGYFSGDGTVNTQWKCIEVSSVSKELITGISLLLSYFGIFSKISGHQTKNNNTENKNIKCCNTLCIRNAYAQRFAEHITLTSADKQMKLVGVIKKATYKYSHGIFMKDFPKDRDVYFDKVVSIEYVDATNGVVYDFTVEKTRNFMLWNGLNVRDTFHRAGSSENSSGTVSKFSELVNATKNPSAPTSLVYFKSGNSTIRELVETIGSSLVEITFETIVSDWEVHIDKEREPWYDAFDLVYNDEYTEYTDCISLTINMEKLFEHNLTLREIARVIDSYDDMKCVFAPDCYGRMDVFVDTKTITLSEEKLAFVTPENAREIYLEEVVFPIMSNIQICGIKGITNMYFLRDGDQWMVETDGTNFGELLAHPNVDAPRVISSNLWDIYHTLGIEATRQFMIEQFTAIMAGINVCHTMVLVDRMTYKGTISSITRYSMRAEPPLASASFEETMDNFIKAGIAGQTEQINGVSGAIICGKMAAVGTGGTRLSMDMDRLMELQAIAE